jgi:ABC-type Mn2+/Zn2+ transport system permease subunit
MLSEPFMQRALAEVLILAVACGPLGVWVLLYRQSYAAESLSHAMLPGLVVASLAGVSLLLGAAAGILGAAVAIALAQRRLGGDVGVAVAIASLFGLGALLALSPDVPARLGELLFGDLLGVTAGDLVEAAVLAAAVLVALGLSHRRLALSVFDRAAAPSLGARPARWELVLLALLAVCTIAAVRGLGNLLVVALILAPAAAALNLAARLPVALGLAAALAALAGVLGLFASYHWDVAAGASVALAAVLVFVLSLLVPARALRVP